MDLKTKRFASPGRGLAAWVCLSCAAATACGGRGVAASGSGSSGQAVAASGAARSGESGDGASGTTSGIVAVSGNASAGSSMCAGKGVQSGSSGQANAECVLGQRTVPPYPFCLTPDYSPDASPGTCASADATACQAVPWLTACEKLTKAPTLDAKSHVLSMQFPAPVVSGTATVRLAYSTDGALCEFVRAPLMVQGTTLKLDLSQYYNDSCVLSIEVTVVTVVDACGNSMTITTMPSEPGGPGPFGIPIDKASGTAIGGGSCIWA